MSARNLKVLYPPSRKQPHYKCLVVVVSILLINSIAVVITNSKMIAADQPEATASKNLKEMPSFLNISENLTSAADTETNLHSALNIINIQNYSEATRAWENVTTIAFKGKNFYSGFRNQMMAFTMLVLDTIKSGHGQILLETIQMKDTYVYGRYSRIFPFELIWDVPHFNSFYPNLPRLVHVDEKIHKQYNVAERDWYWSNGLFSNKNGTEKTPHGTLPYVGDKFQSRLLGMYMRYTKGKLKEFSGIDGGLNPAEILMHQGALRPNPKFLSVYENVLKNKFKDNKHKDDYMTLHARVEPDMQAHPVCRDQKVMKLDEIFTFMESTWPEPPAYNLIVPIDRGSLESQGYPDKLNPNSTNWIAVNNLKVLNDAVSKGLWNGRVKVYELGSRVLNGTEYQHIMSTGGSALNFFHAINAKIFIGTPISSFSHSIMTTRFYRNMTENYKYLPAGVAQWTPPGIKSPEGFGC